MNGVAEYTYEKNHLTEAEALERYEREKSLYPDGLVVLEDLDCGHWEVNVYRTESEKEIFFQKKLTEMLYHFWLTFGQ